MFYVFLPISKFVVSLFTHIKVFNFPGSSYNLSGPRNPPNSGYNSFSLLNINTWYWRLAKSLSRIRGKLQVQGLQDRYSLSATENLNFNAGSQRTRYLELEVYLMVALKFYITNSHINNIYRDSYGKRC